MKSKENQYEQRSNKALFFPLRFFREVKHMLKYFYISLTLSMRKKISFDYSIMFLLSMILTLCLTLFGFSVYRINEVDHQIVDEIFELVIQRDNGLYDTQTLENQLEVISNSKQIGIMITVVESSDADLQDVYVTALHPIEDYNISFGERFQQLLKKGYVYRSTNRYFTTDSGIRMDYEIGMIYSMDLVKNELWVLGGLITLGYFIGFVVIFLMSSYKLKQVFKPIYAMTKAAEKISINDMDDKLDVSRAKYELKDLAMTFNDMLDRLRTDYDKQRRFVSDVSHELRTPISIVNGYVRMLDRWGKEDEAILEESIAAIKSESKNMQNLVENLLTLVRSDNQTLKFEKEYFDIGKMAQEVMKDMTLVDDGKHRFEEDIQMDINVCLDYSKTKQTFRIFIDNAIKYTQEGGMIKLKLRKEYNSVSISFIDTGIGVTKEDLPYLFERFYRSDESRTRQTGGHGLGLSIAKAMVIGQNGRLRVKSKPKEGSEFIMVLPITQDCEPTV